MRRLLDALAETVKLDAIPAWLNQPNPAFGNITPLKAIELGQIDRLWQMVYDLRSERTGQRGQVKNGREGRPSRIRTMSRF